jgi:hypothetical protein
MTKEEVIARWQSRLAEWSRLHVQVGGEEVAREILHDLKDIADTYENGSLSLAEAARESGYSTRQLSRLICQGQLSNVGRRNAPRLLRKDLPKKIRSVSGANPPPDSTLSIARRVVSARSSERGRRNGTAA